MDLRFWMCTSSQKVVRSCSHRNPWPPSAIAAWNQLLPATCKPIQRPTSVAFSNQSAAGFRQSYMTGMI